jgi:hypothetical protein
MASKRRRSYRGTPAQHRSSAARELISVRRAISASNDYIRAGKCPTALDFLIVAENSWGAWEANRGYAKKGGMDRPGKSYSPIALRLIRLKQALKSACFR